MAGVAGVDGVDGVTEVTGVTGTKGFTPERFLRILRVRSTAHAYSNMLWSFLIVCSIRMLLSFSSLSF